MSDIKRYRPIGILPIRDDEHGGFVRHSDHLDALKQSRIDAVREFKQWAYDKKRYDFTDYAEQFIEQELSND